jgi:hypothetical protein
VAKRSTTSHHLSRSGAIRRGILTSFDPVTYTAGVMLFEATSTFLSSVPIAYHADGTSALKNNLCAVLFFDHQNYSDAVIIAIYPGAGVGAPVYPPGRVTIIPTFQPVNAVTINAGITSTVTVAGTNHIPVGALAVLYHVFFHSVTLGSFIDLNAHGIGHQVSWGNVTVANVDINGSGTLPLSSDGKFDITANVGNCVISMYIYGYVI